MKRNVTIILIVIGLIFVVGFVLGALFSERITNCTTDAYCECPEDVGYVGIPCNDCEVADPLFVTGAANIVRSCSGKEIRACGFRVIDSLEASYIDVEKSSCEYNLKFFELYG